MTAEKQITHGKTGSYVTGFVLSVLLTLFSYFVVTMHLLPTVTAIFVIVTLAFIQLTVQLLSFLHLNNKPESKWNSMVFLSTVPIVFLIVAGSIWIMTHLNYNMSPQTIDRHIQNEEGIHK